MSFQFGAPAPGAGPNPAPAAGGLGPTQSAPPTAAPISFAAANPTPTTTAGTTQTPASGGTGAPAPSGFSFGTAAPPSGAATSAPSTQPKTTLGFSFGGGTSAPSAPGNAAAPSTKSSFGSSSLSAPLTTSAATTSATQPAADLVEVPPFWHVFPNLKIQEKLEGLLHAVDDFEREELISVLQCTDGDNVYGKRLSQPEPLEFKFRNDAIRQKLQAKPTVLLRGKEATLTLPMLQMTEELSNDLRVSEEDAMTLLAEVSNPAVAALLESNVSRSFVKSALDDKPVLSQLALGGDQVLAAKELYFYERGALWRALLTLCQHRLRQNPIVLEATDGLLQNNLIQNVVSFIRTSTEHVVKLSHELQRPPHTVAVITSSANADSSVKVLLQFLIDQRQVATECLFYLAYSTQCTPAEVAALLDLIRDLTNGLSSQDTGLPILDHQRDVPDPYEQDPVLQQFGLPFTQALPPRKEKDPFAWHEELVNHVWNTGQPQLMQCVGVLIASALSALDARQQFVSRTTHKTVSTNSLYRADDPATALNVMPLHERLDASDPKVRDGWKRKDIWGLLASSYALLLRPPPTGLASPRSPRVGRIDIKKTWKACLKAPQECKSFTFARWTWLPSFQHYGGQQDDIVCNLREFLWTVATEFISHYVDVVTDARLLPYSRARWKTTEEEKLSVRRDQQAQSRQFGAQYGLKQADDRLIPDHVDISQRPDCSDDIVALVVTICEAGPAYAIKFWEFAEDGTWVKNRLLVRLEQLMKDDKSLIASYAFFLGALSIAGTSKSSAATFVHEMLMKGNPTSDGYCLGWESLLLTIRWYARELSPQYDSSAKKDTSSSYAAGTQGQASTCYYYGAEDNGFSGTSGVTTTSSSRTSSDSKPKELGEENLTILLSHLSIMMRVACRSATARATLLGMQVKDSSVSEGESVLVILFSLAISALTPELRGSVFATLASLLRSEGASVEERAAIHDMCRKAWDLLELSGVLPVLLLSQYRTIAPDQYPQTVAFPPSMLSLARSSTSSAYLPADPKLGVVFELEHIESKLGTYPSTEGLLQLLSALVTTVGCPYNLGSSNVFDQGIRPQPGCLPYVEYVTNFVLPKVLTPNACFRTEYDKQRVIALAFQVVQNVITRYAVPPLRARSPLPQLVNDIEKQKEAFDAAATLLRVPSLAEQVIISPSEQEMVGYRLDFEAKSLLEQPQNGTDGSGQSSVGHPGMVLPRAKSPGYVLLCEILGLREGGLFGMLEYCLVTDGADAGIVSHCRWGSFRSDNAISLFGDLVPSHSSAKGVSARLNPIHPSPVSESTPTDLSRDVVVWREKSVAETLRILCAAAVREAAFMEATGQSVRMVPMLSFRSKGSIIRSWDVQLAKLKDKLSIFQHGQLVPTITRFIGYSAINDVEDGLLPASALALAAYVCKDYSYDQSMRLLCGPRDSTGFLFTEMVAKRLHLSAQRQAMSNAHVDVVKLVMSLLRAPVISDRLLGGSTGSLTPGEGPLPPKSGCLGVLLHLLEDDAFITDVETSGLASECYEIVSHLVTRHAQDQMSYMLIQQRLESNQFWARNLRRLLLGCRSKPALLTLFGGGAKSDQYQREIISSVSWFSQALAEHLGITVFSRNTVLSPNLDDQTKQVLSVLFSDHNLCKIFDALPLPAVSPSLPQVLRAFGSVISECMIPMKDSFAASTGYRVVDVGQLCTSLRAHLHSPSVESTIDEARKWALEWNGAMEQTCSSFGVSRSLMALLHVGLSSLGSRLGGFQPYKQQTQLQLVDLLYLLCTHVSNVKTPGSISQSKSTLINVSVAILLVADNLATSKMDALKSLLPSMALTVAQAAHDVMQSTEDSVSNSESGLILASAVSRLLQCDDEIDVPTELVRVLSSLVVPLARQSCYHGLVKSEPSPGAVLARGTLTGLLDLIGKSDGETIAIPKEHAEMLIKTLGSMDDNIFSLLVKLSRYPNYSQVLLRVDVLEGMKGAIRSFREAASQRLQNLSASAHPASDGTVPGFLLGHLSLLNALLLSKEMKPSVAVELCSQAMSLLNENRDIFRIIHSQFPSCGDTWMEVVLCLELIASHNANSHSFGAIALASRSVVPAEFVDMVLTVTLDLLRYPFPKRLLPVLPSTLRGVDPAATSDRGKCWWDAVESTDAAAGAITMPDPSFTSLLFVTASGASHSWSDDKYEAAIAGVKVLDRSLTFLVAQAQRSETARLDEHALSSGVCTYINTTRLVHDRIRELEKLQKGNSGLFRGIGTDLEIDAYRQRMLETETVYLKRLAPLLVRSCERVLTLAYYLFRNVEDEKYPGYRKALSKALTITLDHTKVETLGVGPNVSSFAIEVSKSLRKHLE